MRARNDSLKGFWGRSPSGVQGQIPGHEVTGPKQKTFQLFGVQQKQKIRLNLRIFQTP